MSCAAAWSTSRRRGLRRRPIGQGDRHQRRGHGEADAVEQEGQRRDRGEEQATERRADEVLGRGLGGEEHTVGLAPGRASRTRLGSTAWAGAGDEGLADADQEDGEQQCAQGALVGHDGHGEGGEHDGAGQLHGDHQAAPVAAIDERAGGQRHQQPGQAGRYGHRHDQSRVVGQMGGQEGEGRQHQAVADAGHARRRAAPDGRVAPDGRHAASGRFHPCSPPFGTVHWRVNEAERPGGRRGADHPDRSVMLVNRRSSWWGVRRSDRAYRSWGSPDRGEPHDQVEKVMSTPPLGLLRSSATVGGGGG